MRIMLLSLVCLALSGCNTGPKLKSKSAYLNTDSYKSVSSAGIVPLVVRTKKRKSSVEGSVQGKGIVGLPLRNIDVTLYDKNKRVLKKTKTNSKGEYRFLENLENGEYMLELVYKNKTQQRTFSLKGYSAKVLKVYFD